MHFLILVRRLLHEFQILQRKEKLKKWEIGGEARAMFWVYGRKVNTDIIGVLL